MELIESKFRRVRAMVSGKSSNNSNPKVLTCKTRPSVTWADRRRPTLTNASPHLFRRFQDSFLSLDSNTTSDKTIQLDNRPSPSPSKFQKPFQQHSNSLLLTSGVNFPELTIGEKQVTINDNHNNVTTTTTISASPTPTLAAKVLFSRQLSVNFGKVTGDDVMCYGESDFVVECLYWHNVFRQRHSAPPLVLSSQLCQSAQQWANTLAHNEMFYHSNPQNCGENLFTRSSFDPEYDVTGRETTVSWYSGIKQYNFNAEPELLHVNAGKLNPKVKQTKGHPSDRIQSMTFHLTNSGQFTQMVWCESTELGIGKARTRGGKVLVVAHYSPQGNVFRRFKENVLTERSITNDVDTTTSNVEIAQVDEQLNNNNHFAENN